MRQPGRHQGTVPIVQPATSACSGGTLGPAPGQCAFGIAPADELLQAPEFRRTTHVAAQSTTRFIDAEDPPDASLPFTSGAFQGCNVVGFEVTVLAIEKHRKLAQRLALVMDETSEPFAAL
jgi:hypothetical protein